MTDPTDDWPLLKAYCATKSHQAFEELVQRHIGLVYAAARRRSGNADLADDITQAVFMTLAAKASTLSQQTPLPIWLYRTTRFISANAMKTEKRRQRHEKQSAVQRPTITQPPDEQNDALLAML